MSARAFQHVGERVYVEGVPFGGWIETGDCYTSDAPLWDGDVDLVATVEAAEAEVRALNERPAPPPTALWSLAEDEATYIDIESAIHQHMGHDGQSDEANDWVTDLISAIAPFIEYAVNSRDGADPETNDA